MQAKTSYSINMELSLDKKLGKRIKELRVANGLTQGMMADMLDMERSNLTRIETGKQHPNSENIEKIAETLNVQVKDLYDFEHFKSTEEMKKAIISNINEFDDKNLMFVYKTIQNIKELK